MRGVLVSSLKNRCRVSTCGGVCAATSGTRFRLTEMHVGRERHRPKAQPECITWWDLRTKKPNHRDYLRATQGESRYHWGLSYVCLEQGTQSWPLIITNQEHYLIISNWEDKVRKEQYPVAEGWCENLSPSEISAASAVYSNKIHKSVLK